MGACTVSAGHGAGLLCLRCSPRPELSVGHLDGDRLRRCVALEELSQVGAAAVAATLPVGCVQAFCLK